MDSGLKIFNSTLITSQDSGWYKNLNFFPLDLEGLLAEIFILKSVPWPPDQCVKRENLTTYYNK